jgi:hypothetical protein
MYIVIFGIVFAALTFINTGKSTGKFCNIFGFSLLSFEAGNRKKT